MFFIKKFTNKIAAVVTILSCLITPANALDFTFDYGNNFGAGGYKKGIVYTLLAALNVSNPNPRTALLGDTATQVATGAVTIPNQLGTLVTLPATYPAIEGARIVKNLLLQSQEFDATWTLTNSTVDDQAAVAPDGTTTADKLIPSAVSSGSHLVLQAVTLTATTYTFSVYAKAAGYDFLVMKSELAGYAEFNLATGADPTVVAANYTAAIVNEGDGWYRCSITYTATAASYQNFLYAYNTTGAPEYAGNGTSGIYLWGAQVELGATASEYVPTTTAVGYGFYAPSEATATVLSSGLTRYTGNAYGQPGLGVLAEPAATNVILQSQTLGIAWSANDAKSLLAADNTAAPDGTTTADKIYDNNSGGAAGPVGYYQVKTLSAGVIYTYSIYVKSSGLSKCFLSTYGYDTTANGYSYFDLSAGTVGTKASQHSSSTITALGAGWFRCSVTFATSSDLIGGVGIYAAEADGSKDCEYDNTSSIFSWGAQLETGSVATSYIPTTTAAVTRPPRYTTEPGSRFGTDIRFDAVVKNLGTEMAFIGDPTSLAYLYKNSADKVVWRGSSLGDELVDSQGAGGTGWITEAGNTVELDGAEVKITYGTASAGASLYLRNVSALTSDLTVGATYKLTIQSRVNSGNYVIRLTNTSLGTVDSATKTNTTNIEYSLVFKAASTNASVLSIQQMGTSEIVWVSAVSLKLVKELTSTSSLVANTPAIIGVHQGTDGATLYVNGTAEATDATMTTPVTWGTTVRLGADTAATAGNVLNGSISLVHSSNDERLFETSQIIELPNYENIVYLADRRKKIKIPEYERKAA